MKRATPVLLLAVLLLTGCLKADAVSRYTPAWEEFSPTGPDWKRTQKVLVIADCQLHNLYSDSLPERNLTAKAAAGSAIRSPQLDLFSADVLKWIFDNKATDTDFILHLGDAIDVSTDGEWEDFVRVMDEAGIPWIMAPGNHDGYYMGSYYTVDEELWKSGSYLSGDPLTKDRFIRVYVGALLKQPSGEFEPLARALGVEGMAGKTMWEIGDELPLTFEWEAPDDVDCDLRAICWGIDEVSPWRSFILQSAEMGKAGGEFSFRTLLLDSCQYKRRPTLVPNAWQSYPLVLNCGFSGEMLPNQLRVVRRWIEAGGERRTHLLCCHHPFEAIARRTQSSLGFLWRTYVVGLMLTAHTHAGFFAYHDLDGAADKLELNVGSTTDWPMEWRVIQGFYNKNEEQAYVRAERGLLVDELSGKEGYFDLDWEIPLDAPDDYRHYKQGEAANDLILDFVLAHHFVPDWLPPPEVRPNPAARNTEEMVKNALLWTYVRLLERFPTDPTRGEPRWPEGFSSDAVIVEHLKELAQWKGGEEPDSIIRKWLTARKRAADALRVKSGALVEMAAFERSRKSRDPKTGVPNDAERTRYKISQAAWASRFESSEGRRLRVEDELIRVDMKDHALRKELQEK